MTKPDHAKPYTLTYETRPGYLYVYVEGENDSYEISREYWREVARESGRLGKKRVLIDENIPDPSTIADAFKFASEIPQMGFGSARIAFVDRYLEQNEINLFGELVAVNRGVNAKVFNDTASAEEWLLID